MSECYWSYSEEFQNAFVWLHLEMSSLGVFDYLIIYRPTSMFNLLQPRKSEDRTRVKNPILNSNFIGPVSLRSSYYGRWLMILKNFDFVEETKYVPRENKNYAIFGLGLGDFFERATLAYSTSERDCGEILRKSRFEWVSLQKFVCSMMKI